MLRPIRMKKVQALIYHTYFDDVARALRDFKTFHVIDLTKEGDLSEWEGLLRSSEASQLISKSSSLIFRIDRLLEDLEVHTKVVETLLIKQESLDEVLTEAENMVAVVEEAYKGLISKLQELKDQPEDASAKEQNLGELKKLATERGDELQFTRETLRVQKELEELKLMTGRTDFTFLVEGWVPAGTESKATDTIEKATNGHCITRVSAPSEHEHAPTMLRNPRLLKVFEGLTTSYGMPSYHEIDPTLLISLTFPAIFGLMFADVGQGLLLILFGLAMMYLNKKTPQPSEMLGYLIKNGVFFVLLGVFAVLGGFLYGEFFGFHNIIQPIGFSIRFGKMEIPIGGFNPVEALKNGEIMPMFKFAIFVGVIHISFGLIMNLVIKVLNKEFKEAFFESTCWLWQYLGLMYLVFTYSVNIQAWFENVQVVAVALVLPIVLMLVGKGLLEGFMEGFSFMFEAFVSSLGNTVSYGRIMALLLSHAMMSSMFVTLSEGQGLPVQLLLVGMGTFLVMVLEGLIIFVHTIRLHWVEWFSKFYEGEGMQYKLLGGTFGK